MSFAIQNKIQAVWLGTLNFMNFLNLDLIQKCCCKYTFFINFQLFETTYVQLCVGPKVHVVIDIAHGGIYKQWLWLRGRNKKSHHLQPTNYRTLTNTYVNISIHSVQYDRKSSPVLNVSNLFWRSSLLSFRHHFRTGWGHFRAITNFFIIATSWLVEKFPRHLKPYGRELNSDKKYDTFFLIHKNFNKNTNIKAFID